MSYKCLQGNQFFAATPTWAAFWFDCWLISTLQSTWADAWCEASAGKHQWELRGEEKGFPHIIIITQQFKIYLHEYVNSLYHNEIKWNAIKKVNSVDHCCVFLHALVIEASTATSFSYGVPPFTGNSYVLHTVQIKLDVKEGKCGGVPFHKNSFLYWTCIKKRKNTFLCLYNYVYLNL